MLVTMKDILVNANKGNYAVAAPNVFTELDARAYIEASEELKSPLILDYAYNSNADINMMGDILIGLAIQSNVPIAINLDHGGPKRHIISAIRAGFSSVMVDRSALPFEDNVREVKEIVDIAHSVGVSVEAELGRVGQAISYNNDRDAALTNVEEAVKFVELTGVDCLAVAIGTAHGAYPKGITPYINFERLSEIKSELSDLPLVLHGSSGTDINDLRKACCMGINKVNIANDLCRAAVNVIKNSDLEGQTAYNIYGVLREGVKNKLCEMIKIYGSEGKTWMPEFKGIKKGVNSMAE